MHRSASLATNTMLFFSFPFFASQRLTAPLSEELRASDIHTVALAAGGNTQHSKRISCAECRGEWEETIHPLAGATGRAVEPCVFEQALSFLT